MPRFLISVLIPISLAAAISSCEKTGVPTATARPGKENILHYDVNTPLESLNPAQAKCTASNHVFPLLYSYLVVPNSKGEIEADLASKWSYDPKTFTWTIYLREDAVFHNKKPVTSGDVKYSLQTVLKQTRPLLFSFIEEISLLSDTALSVRLKKDEPLFLQKTWDINIVHQSSEGKTDDDHHPVGSGPFRFKYRKGDKKIGLVANEDYFKGRPALDGVVFHYQPDKEKTWTRLLSGETDVGHEISPKNYEMIHQYENRYYFDVYPLRYYTILLYNTRAPLFSDLKVRMALSYAINGQYIVEEILKGRGVITVGPMGVDSPFHNPEVKPIAYDPQRGAKLLKEAGWSYDENGHHLLKDGRRFEFTILVFEESQVEKKVAQYIRLCLNDLGIVAQVESQPFVEVRRRYFANNAFQTVITEFSGAYRNPEYLGELWCGSFCTASVAGCFDHPGVNRLFHEALDEEDPVKQRQLFYEIDALITSLQPGTFLFHKTPIFVANQD